MTRALRRGIIEVPNSSEAHAALALLNTRLMRIESMRLAPSDAPLDETTRALFVRYGAAILSMPDLATPAAEALGTGLEYGELQLSLESLCQWLRLLKIMPRRIFCLADLDSQILGRALAYQLNIEFEVTNGDGYTHSKSLIVTADNRALLAAPLRTIFPAQVLYSLNLHREGGAIAPDVAGMSRAGLLFPWRDERLTTRKIATIAERIVNAPAPMNSDNWQSRLEFYRARRDLLTAGNSCYSRLSMLPESL